MTTASPLRYPGGKSAMSGLVSAIRSLNQLGHLSMAEPFAGGAGASLNLLFREDTPEIYINDIDESIYAFWWTLINRPQPFLARLKSTRVTIPEWKRQREVYRTTGRVSRLRRGFAAFYLNRCNRSGIVMNGGPIGGIDQRGRWKLNARFNKATLTQRCERIVEYSPRIHVSREDGIRFMTGLNNERVFFLIDPPYYDKGPTLYLNRLDHAYHANLAKQLQTMEETAWVLTYDDCPQIRALYSRWANVRPFSLRYAASQRRRGKEILITPRWIQLPATQGSAAIGW